EYRGFSGAESRAAVTALRAMSAAVLRCLRASAQRFRSPTISVNRGMLTHRLGRMGTPELQERIANLMRAADTGIADFEVVEETDEELAVRVARRQGAGGDFTPQRQTRLLFRHTCGAGEFTLSLQDESEGTQQMFHLAVSVLPALEDGGVLLADELDASLHTYLSAKPIQLFQDPVTNPRGAQLIFASHDSALLGRVQGRDVLRRDQIWFTEKGEDGSTQLFPLTDFKPRKEDNRERRYLTGRYGAVPNVDDELFMAALATRVDSAHVPPACPRATAAHVDRRLKEGLFSNVDSPERGLRESAFSSFVKATPRNVTSQGCAHVASRFLRLSIPRSITLT
ncbi:AAA family ATPase, partial [Streptomyces anulatus]|uniref:AAA family ATPase n=1 Tax=Streptomyces anulatus TaxID=1892 RepID=UPI003439B478